MHMFKWFAVIGAVSVAIAACSGGEKAKQNKPEVVFEEVEVIEVNESTNKMSATTNASTNTSSSTNAMDKADMKSTNNQQ